MENNIVVLTAEEILPGEELHALTDTAGYYMVDMLKCIRPMFQQFGASNNWTDAKVVVLVTAICGCCGGNRVVSEAAKLLQTQGFLGTILGRTFGDERNYAEDLRPSPELIWAKDRMTAEEMIKLASELASQPNLT